MFKLDRIHIVPTCLHPKAEKCFRFHQPNQFRLTMCLYVLSAHVLETNPKQNIMDNDYLSKNGFIIFLMCSRTFIPLKEISRYLLFPLQSIFLNRTLFLYLFASMDFQCCTNLPNPDAKNNTYTVVSRPSRFTVIGCLA